MYAHARESNPLAQPRPWLARCPCTAHKAQTLPGCAGTHDGALQQTARFIDSLGFNATSEDTFLPNAAVLRSAEAIDAIANAGRSGVSAESATASAGYTLCAIVQLGGVSAFNAPPSLAHTHTLVLDASAPLLGSLRPVDRGHRHHPPCLFAVSMHACLRSHHSTARF